jgi:Domain of unknown function (DUF1929)
MDSSMGMPAAAGGTVPPLDPSDAGRWEPIEHQFRWLPVHTALLHTGKVLAFGGSGNDRQNLAAPHRAELFDPVAGTVTTVEQDLAADVFCSGHCFLPDGRLLVAGGTRGYDVQRFNGLPLPPFTGHPQTYLFDPVSERWARGPDMAESRWYPTLIGLGDGSVVSVAGLAGGFPWVFLRALETYQPETGWGHLSGADRWLPLYPRLHLMPDGRILYAGSYNTHLTFPFSISSFPTGTLDPVSRSWSGIGLPKQSEHEEGTTTLLTLIPPDYRAKVLLAGGGLPRGTASVADAEILDYSAPNPAWRAVASMANARYHCYSVLLPDRTVLLLGGKSGPHKGMPMGDMAPMSPPPQDPMAVRQPELFDPATEMWRPAAKMEVDRVYHSGALLLPDGRVIVTGSNPASGQNELRIEIYRPPYLSGQTRPEIVAAPSEIANGDEFIVGVSAGRPIDVVSLVRQASTTHCFSTEQRSVELEFERSTGKKLKVRVPESGNLLPPGWYMLFVLSEGIPSVAKFVHLKPPAGSGS